jgi:multiple sugar transport system permease protein
MAVSSLGGAERIVSLGFDWSQFNPLTWTIQPFVDAWSWAGLKNFAVTSVMYSCSVTLLCTVTSSMAGYAFGRLRFPGRSLLFGLVLATVMIPRSVTMIPLFTLLLHLPLVGGNNIVGVGGKGLYDTLLGLILPEMVGATSIFLCRQFFQTLPSDLEDAARIDGCTEVGIWRKIIIPLSGPVLTVVALFEFQRTWNAFLWPLIMSRSEKLYTIQVGLYSLMSVWCDESAMEYMSLLMASSVIAVLPVLVLFILFQRQFVQGIALTGLK